MMLVLLPLVAVALAPAGNGDDAAAAAAGDGAGDAGAGDAGAMPAAQVQLAEALAGADAIEGVAVGRRQVELAIVRGGERQRVIARIGRSGEVVGLAIARAGRAGAARHALTWLAAELEGTAAVVRLVPGERGGVVLATSDGRSYLLAPRRAPRTGNEAVEARWGAAWEQPAS